MIFPSHLEQKILQVLRTAHPYEEVAYEVILLENYNQDIGSGMVGTLSQEMEEIDFLYFLKEKMQTKCIRHTQLLGKKIKTIAFCGGAGSFLLPQAKSINADIFITGDYKYHEFFDAEKQIIIAEELFKGAMKKENCDFINGATQIGENIFILGSIDFSVRILKILSLKNERLSILPGVPQRTFLRLF